MSICIALNFEEGVLLMADGRQTEINSNSVLLDNFDKVYKIKKNLFVVPFGIHTVIEKVITLLQDTTTEITDVQETCKEISILLADNFQNFLTKEALLIDKNSPIIKAGLIIAGIVDTKPTIIGILEGVQGNLSSMVFSQPYEYMVIGGEEQYSDEIFESEVIKVKDLYTNKMGDSSMNIYIKNLISAGAKTIKAVASKNDRIGGTIRYVILRRQFDSVKGIFED